MALLRRLPLLRRFPTFHPLPHEAQQLIPPDEMSKYPGLSKDFATLERELMPYFRELDNEATSAQNWYRWLYVILIFGGAVVTILAIVQLAFVDAVGIGVGGGLVAALLAGATAVSRAFHHHERYLNARLATERLRGEYFLFLGHLKHYADEQDRVQKLIRHVAEIKMRGEYYEPAG